MQVSVSAPALQYTPHPKTEREAVYNETNKIHHPIPRTPGECLTETMKPETNQKRILGFAKQATVAGLFMRVFQRTLPTIST